MSIATAIQNAQQKIENAYTAISNKGGTLPETQNLSNMPTAINSIQTGLEPAIESLTISPSTSEQVITVPSGIDGYSPITVVGVTYEIDSNIASSNIKDGVTILGITGNVKELNTTSLSVNPSTSSQTFAPSSPYNGYNEVNVSAVTSSIDSNIKPENIKDGVNVLGVLGTYSGIQPTLITKNITSNGTYYASSDSADGYSVVSVNVPTGYTEIPSYQVSSGSAVRRTISLTGQEFSNITSIGEGGLYQCFSNCVGILGNVNLSSVTTIGRYGMYFSFTKCVGITSVDLRNVVSIDEQGLRSCFNGCSSLSNINVSGLTTIGSEGMAGALSGCSSLETIDFLVLENIGYFCLSSAFLNCTALTDIYFRSLKTTSFSFKNQFSQMMSGVTNTTIHFPSNLENSIRELYGYPNFGGSTGSVILAFDLPATS